MAKALPIAEISRRTTIFYLDDVIGIEAMIRRGVLAALTRDPDCLAAPAGAFKNRNSPGLMFGRLIPISSDLALDTGKGTRQGLNERRQLRRAMMFGHGGTTP